MFSAVRFQHNGSASHTEHKDSYQLFWSAVDTWCSWNAAIVSFSATRQSEYFTHQLQLRRHTNSIKKISFTLKSPHFKAMIIFIKFEKHRQSSLVGCALDENTNCKTSRLNYPNGNHASMDTMYAHSYYSRTISYTKNCYVFIALMNFNYKMFTTTLWLGLIKSAELGFFHFHHWFL